MTPFISICIPAYRQADYLERLMNSIAVQTFPDYEVIVTDDSPGNEVGLVCEKYKPAFSLAYQKNSHPLGSPANWNEAIRMAKGEWIKIMHHDDWFADPNSLAVFAKVAEDHTGQSFIFSGYTNYDQGKIKNENIPGAFVEKKLKDPFNLIARNYIGHPSTTLIRNNRQNWYDERTKWIVDIEFYIRCLQSGSFHLIKKSLINIGMHNEQITTVSFRNALIEIPEYLYLLDKMGEKILQNINVYDHYWRLFRNLNIRTFEEIDQIEGDKKIPEKLKTMLEMEFRIPLPLLKVGVVSKLFMTMSYWSNQ